MKDAMQMADALMMAICEGNQRNCCITGPVHTTCEPFQRLMKDNGVTCSMSRSGNVWGCGRRELLLQRSIERVKRKVH
jgi:putative transposase